MKIPSPMQLRGVVARVRINRDGDPALPLTWMEYLKRQPQLVLQLSAAPVREWTPDRGEADVMDWDAACALSATIPGSHAIVASMRVEDLAAEEDGQQALQAHEARAVRIEEVQLPRAKSRRGRNGIPPWQRRGATAPETTFQRLEKEHLA